MDCYLSIEGESAVEQIIEKSKFIAVAAHVTNLSEIAEHLHSAKTKFPQARHYVYAYRLREGRFEKSTDDGEPQGTGGHPVLDIIQHRDLWDIQIIVIRYFGGVLLGTGGLTRAYGRTARMAIEQAIIVQQKPKQSYELTMPYPKYEQMKYLLKQRGWESVGETFTEQIGFRVYVNEEDSNFFENWLDEVSNKQVLWKKGELLLVKEKA